MRSAWGVVAALSLAACGSSGPEMSITVQPLSGGTSYDMRLFGFAVPCPTDAAGRTTAESYGPCGSINPDQNHCFIEKDLVQLNATFYFADVTPGTRSVLGLELDASGAELGWACQTATVSAGAVSTLKLVFVAGM